MHATVTPNPTDREPGFGMNGFNGQVLPDPQLSGFTVYLERFARRLRLRDGWILAQHTLIPACLLALWIQLAGRLWPIEHLWAWTAAPLGGWLALVPTISLVRPLPLMRVACRLDVELGLKERLSTAVFLYSRQSGERGSEPSWSSTFQPSLVAHQLQDALNVVQFIDPRRACPLPWQRRSLAVAAALAALTFAFAAMPNPMDNVLAERDAVARVAEEQAERIQAVRDEIQAVQGLSPSDRQELLRQLADLVEELQNNPGNREEALANLSRVEEMVRSRLDPNAEARQAALEALAGQLQSLTGATDASNALAELARQMDDLEAGEQQALARTLAKMAARTAQSGDTNLAQALAALAQALQSGNLDGVQQAAHATSEAASRAQSQLASQAALQQALAQLRASRGALAQAGANHDQGPGGGQGQGKGEGQGRGQGEGAGQEQGEGQSPGQGQGQGEGKGQGQGQTGQPGSGGGTKADTLPPSRRTGKAGHPRGPGQPGTAGSLDDQVYVPRERLETSGAELTLSGQDSGQGETQVHQKQESLPGAPGEALVPYDEVYYTYLDAANQAMESSYIPPGLQELVREYFTLLEP
jgi:hypothetical protein